MPEQSDLKMTDQFDIMIAAKLMVAEHGELALVRAKNCVAMLVKVGDELAAARWRGVVDTIAGLCATTPCKQGSGS